MSKKLSRSEVIALVSQAEIEPSEAFVSQIRKEYKSKPRAFRRSTSNEKTSLTKMKMIIVCSAVCAVVLLGVVMNKLIAVPSAYAAEYSYEQFDRNMTTDVSKEFIENEYRSMKMMNDFWKCLPYSGQYKTTGATGSYTVDGILADGYPDYYAGYYINVDGKLIVVIKDDFYDEDYRKCNWYKELAKMLGNEDFACRPVKYNYTEIINGCSDLAYGELGKKIRGAGVEWVAFGSYDYDNTIKIEVKTDEDAAIVKTMATSDLFSVAVVGDIVLEDQ